jgi:hypothetical protein
MYIWIFFLEFFDILEKKQKNYLMGASRPTTQIAFSCFCFQHLLCQRFPISLCSHPHAFFLGDGGRKITQL